MKSTGKSLDGILGLKYELTEHELDRCVEGSCPFMLGSDRLQILCIEGGHPDCPIIDFCNRDSDRLIEWAKKQKRVA